MGKEHPGSRGIPGDRGHPGEYGHLEDRSIPGSSGIPGNMNIPGTGESRETRVIPVGGSSDTGQGRQCSRELSHNAGGACPPGHTGHWAPAAA